MGSHSIRAKSSYFSALLDLDVTSGSPLTQPAMTLAADYIKLYKVGRFERTAEKNNIIK